MKKYVCLLLVLLSFSFVEFNNEPVVFNNSCDATYFGYNMVTNPDNYSSNINSYNDFKTSYFDNLTQNFGMNYKGSCGYVAIGMLLSYYDTYLNDSIIKEQYDQESSGSTTDIISRRNSPGVLHDVLLNPKDKYDVEYAKYLSTREYFYEIIKLHDLSFHANLIKIGEKLHFFDNIDDKSFGTDYDRWCKIINKYFADETSFSQNDFSIIGCNEENNSNGSSTVRNFVIEQVKMGKPVLLGVSKNVNGEREGHAVVAYDYDEKSNELYCHIGWNASTTHVTIESQLYENYDSALVIDFNIPHSHSNNYVVKTNVNGVDVKQYYCYDDCEIHTFSNTSEHHYHNYARYSKTMHKVKCVCGDYILSPHEININHITILHGHRYANCINCGELIDLGDTIVIGELNNGYILNNIIFLNDIYIVDFNYQEYTKKKDYM